MRRLLFLAPAQAVSAVFAPLRDAGFELGMAENMKGASLFLEKSDPGVIFARPSMPGFKVEELLTFGADKAEFPPVIIITDKGDAREAERLMSLGARDYWLEPLDMERIAAVAREPRAPVPVPALSTLGGHKPSYEKGPQIVGHAPAIRRVLKLARQVAGSKATVLISGESGTGKEMFSRYLHAMSKRASGPFIAVNCAALPEHLLESELFGHEKGAFTGAIARKLGKFELADGGTLLLDEISEMDLALQAKLLRVLQERVFERVGGTEPISVDIRVVAATNRDLSKMVEEGTFREDLYYRLNIIPIELPPLRMRREDLPALITHYIGYYNQKLNKHLEGMEPEALDAMIAYDWPGNVRELKNIVEYLANIVEGTHVTLSDLPDHIALHGSRGDAPRSLDEMMSDYEKRILMRMVKPGASLEEKNHLADTLQVSRATLYRKLKKYDLI